MRIAREEISGPVISAIPFDDIGEVATPGDRTDVGRGSGLWTRDVYEAHTVAAGGLGLGELYEAMDPAVPSAAAG